MGTIAEKLAYLVETKALIKSAIEGKGVSIPEGATFRSYAELIEHVDNTAYVVGDPVAFTLAADGWNGTTYTLYAYLYAVGDNGVQIGLPSKSSAPNTRAVIEAALTISSTYNYTGSETSQPYARLYIVAVEPPTEDLDIVLFGLAPVADTVVDTASEGTE